MKAFPITAFGWLVSVLVPGIGLAQDTEVPPTQSSESSYQAVQILDGFGAVLVGAGEPIFFPIDQAQECKRESGDSVHAGGCAFIGLLASPFLAVRDVLVGAGDIITGGYFTISRNVGVFDYFDPAASAAREAAETSSYNRGRLQSSASTADFSSSADSGSTSPGYRPYRQASEGSEHLRSYRRKNGTYVRSPSRSKSDSEAN